MSRTTALVTGSVALGALLTSTLLRKLRTNHLRPPQQVPKALDAPVHEMEMMEGRARFYARDGTGVPLVLLHSINAAASSYEMKPLFDHFATATDRPLYALEWFGFGLSDRPPVRYTPALYQRQLRRFLSEYVHQPADVVALSLGSEYAALVAEAHPYLLRKLVLLAPTGLSEEEGSSRLQRALVELASGIGAFDVFFYRLTRPESIRRFYERQVFRSERAVPEELVHYGHVTSQVYGAPHAPRRFIEGTLFTRQEARHAYGRLRIPTLLIIPDEVAHMVQDFARLPEVLTENSAFLTAERLAAGLLPQWEDRQPLLALLDDFIGEG